MVTILGRSRIPSAQRMLSTSRTTCGKVLPGRLRIRKARQTMLLSIVAEAGSQFAITTLRRTEDTLAAITELKHRLAVHVEDANWNAIPIHSPALGLDARKAWHSCAAERFCNSGMQSP